MEDTLFSNAGEGISAACLAAGFPFVLFPYRTEPLLPFILLLVLELLFPDRAEPLLSFIFLLVLELAEVYALWPWFAYVLFPALPPAALGFEPLV